MKYFHYALGVLLTFCLMIALLLTSVEAVTYWTPGYYEKEYAKYNVTAAVQMEMAYLRGRREDLHVPTVVNGQPREFFNDREIAHMEDVCGLFIGGLRLRLLCLAAIVVCLAIMILTKANLRHVLPRAVCAGTGLFFAFVCILAAVIFSDFSKYFIIFHHIFFDNDLWILDPRTDLLINIVPEPFFMDTAARIAITYGISVAAVFLVCLGIVLAGHRKKQKP